jgi:hypothetical protein
MFVAAAPPDAQDFDGDAYDRECDEAERLRIERLFAVTVPADPDADDCLQAAADAMKRAHRGELAGHDLEPSWADASRDRVRLLLPFWSRAWETVRGALLVSPQERTIAQQLRDDLRKLDRGASARTIAAGWVDQIEALRSEALNAGDAECVFECNRVLQAHDRHALRVILNVLADHRGNQGAP